MHTGLCWSRELTPYFETELGKLYCGDVLDVLRQLPDESAQTCVTSPPYWGLRDYGVGGQIGLEKTPEEYVAKMVDVFREVRRVLRGDGTVWLNLGDSYNGSGGAGGDYNNGGLKAGQPKYGRKFTNSLKPKDLCGIPWRVGFALQADGWYLRQDIIWHKPNPMPESVTDRCTKAHEYIFLLSKNARYYYDAEAIAEQSVTLGLKVGGIGKSWHDHKDDLIRGDRKTTPGSNGQHQAFANGRNRRSVWTCATKPYPEAHFATFPPDLIIPCILAGTSEHGCCSECGAPWERVIDKPKIPKEVYTQTGKPESISAIGNHKVGMGQKLQNFYNQNPPKTIGWKPTCKCGRELDYRLWPKPVPCTVLDPFFGSGTTGYVAESNGRRWVGIELNESYCELAKKRIDAKARQRSLFR